MTYASDDNQASGDRIFILVVIDAWWRHGLETFPASPALYEAPSQRACDEDLRCFIVSQDKELICKRLRCMTQIWRNCLMWCSFAVLRSWGSHSKVPNHSHAGKEYQCRIFSCTQSWMGYLNTLHCVCWQLMVRLLYNCVGSLRRVNFTDCHDRRFIYNSLGDMYLIRLSIIHHMHI